jgi:hypothetical protein
MIVDAIKRELVDDITLKIKIIDALLRENFRVLILPALRFGEVARK